MSALPLCSPRLLTPAAAAAVEGFFSSLRALYGGLRQENSGVKLKMNCRHLGMCCREVERVIAYYVCAMKFSLLFFLLPFCLLMALFISPATGR